MNAIDAAAPIQACGGQAETAASAEDLPPGAAVAFTDALAEAKAIPVKPGPTPSPTLDVASLRRPSVASRDAQAASSEPVPRELQAKPPTNAPTPPPPAPPASLDALLFSRDVAVVAARDEAALPATALADDLPASRDSLEDEAVPAEPALTTPPSVVITAPEALLLGAAPLPSPTEVIGTQTADLKDAAAPERELRAQPTGAERAPREEPREAARVEVPASEAPRPATPDLRAPDSAQPPTPPAPVLDTSLPLPPSPPALAVAELPRAPLEDPSLHVFLNAHTARLTVETADAGALSVQLRVNDGIADIRAAGPAAGLLEQRQGELRVALAQQGLSMGQFDLTQSRSGHRHEPKDEAPTGPRPAAAAKPRAGAPAHTGRLSIKA